jgi:tryptophan synthase beta chain
VTRPALHLVPKTPSPAESATPRLHDFRAELERLMLGQLEQQPGLAEVRARLLELYFEQNRREDFVKQAQIYHRALRQPAESREWQRIASMGRMLLPGHALFNVHNADRIEFVGLDAAVTPEPKPKFQRFGEDERHRQLFASLAQCYEEVRRDPRFLAELEMTLLGLATRRPTPLTHARRLSEHLGGAQIYLKREDLAGAHPHLTVAITGQALLARRLGRKAVAIGTTDGRRGLVAATVAARLGLQAVVFMDAEQAQRGAANVSLMKLLGAQVNLVKADQYRNRDIRNAALEYWAANPAEAFLLIGLDAAPQPYPAMTAEMTSLIGRECRRQAARNMPDLVVTRGDGTSDALGVFPAFLGDAQVRLVCTNPEPEPDVEVRDAPDPFNQVGMALSSREQRVAGRIIDRTEYPSVAREHALLKASGRVEYVEVPRTPAREALRNLARLEGVLLPVETAHALAFACAAARSMKPEQSIIVLVAEPLDLNLWDIERALGN